MKHVALSKLGLIRQSNQDRVLAIETPVGFLAMVCDGIGGGNAGDVASQMAVDYFKNSFECLKVLEDDRAVINWFDDSIKAINSKIYKKSITDIDCKGMGTTVICLVIIQGRALGFNVGDSRLYDYRRQSLNLLSHDQTYAYMMYLENQITKEEADNHPDRNVLMNALGVHRHIEYETIRVPDGWDRLMLSSDGLHDYVPLVEIERAFELDLDNTADVLMTKAYEAGGFDNISLVILKGDKDES